MIFENFRKIARLNREMVITEKIDGTNAQVFIVDNNDIGPESPPMPSLAATRSGDALLAMFVGSRNRWITPNDDNAGFAKWALANAEELFKLGPGRHYGEWWGSGIQRGYGLTKGEKRFSLFNTSRWHGLNVPACCGIVPELYRGLFTSEAVGTQIERLRTLGSVAAPGFMNPEGIVIYHTHADQYFKVTLKNDDTPKSLVRNETSG